MEMDRAIRIMSCLFVYAVGVPILDWVMGNEMESAWVMKFWNHIDIRKLIPIIDVSPEEKVEPELQV